MKITGSGGEWAGSQNDVAVMVSTFNMTFLPCRFCSLRFSSFFIQYSFMLTGNSGLSFITNYHNEILRKLSLGMVDDGWERK